MKKAIIKKQECVGCGQCLEFCSAIDALHYGAVINEELCKKCFECLKFDCPGEAFGIEE